MIAGEQVQCLRTKTATIRSSETAGFLEPARSFGTFLDQPRLATNASLYSRLPRLFASSL